MRTYCLVVDPDQRDDGSSLIRLRGATSAMSIESGRQVRILLIDDHTGIRILVREIIEASPGLSVWLEADTRELAMHAVRTSAVDLALVDVTAGGTSGLELVRGLHAANPRVPTLALSIDDEFLIAEQALLAGARGLLPKQQVSDHLIHAILEVLSGRLFVSQRVVQQMLRAMVASRR
jgi:DNA-binding NarL/FixJ family response regulator